jgi:hypothetical protein
MHDDHPEAPGPSPRSPSAAGTPRLERRRRVRAVLKASVLAVIAGATVVSAVRLAVDASGRRRTPEGSSTPPPPGVPARSTPVGSPPQPSRAFPDVPSDVRYVFIGGGAIPESTEVSLEQDLLLAEGVLSGPGAILFAGGAGTFSVRELDPDLEEEAALRTRIGDVLHPRAGRRSRYRPSPVSARPATRKDVEAVLTAALAGSGAPLTVYVAAHGEKGSEPRNNYVSLWGDGALTVERLAELHEAAPRPLRLVSATCFSGGFAELAFHRADEKRGPTSSPRCGLFASMWDREASGCDPNPDRRQQESYSLHLLNALAGRDRNGTELPLEQLDIDGDGRVGLLEAHTRARVASHSIDVPTTTSERLLRAVQTTRGLPARELLPEEARVVDALSKALSLADEPAARRRWEEMDAELEQVDHELNEAEATLDERFAELRALLLGHWPLLDDPYHVDFQRTLAEHGRDIERVLDTAPEAERFRAARERVSTLDDRYFARLASEAMVLRLVRAHETLALAGALGRRGGRDFEAYERLLACERGSP